jgi:hypothetical protein
MPQRRLVWLAAGLLAAGSVAAGCSGESGATTKAPKAFCQAAYNYEQELNKELTKGEKDLNKQLALVEIMAAKAPRKVHEDVLAFADAIRQVRDDPSLAKNKQFQARGRKVVDNVNRYASNGCGFFKQDPSEGI